MLMPELHDYTVAAIQLHRCRCCLHKQATNHIHGRQHCCPLQDPMTDPIKLRCSHIFCDSCISEWFERERTCPMCRAVIKPAGLHSFGDGSTSQLPQAF